MTNPPQNRVPHISLLRCGPRRKAPVLLRLLLALLLTGAAQAQLTTITATNIQTFGSGRVNGSFCVVPVANGVSINLTTPTGQQLAPATPICYPIVNGVLSSAAIVPDTSLAQPVDTCLKVTIENRAGQTIGNYPCIQPSGSTWSFDAFVPVGTPAAPSVELPQFQTNGTVNQSQTSLNLVCAGCTNSGNTVTIPAGGGSGTYTAPSTGAVARTTTGKLADTLSIKDFGAVGDGAHMAADSTALIAAAAAASILGDKLYIPAGTYNLNNSAAAALSGANNVILYGDGPSSSLICNTTGSNDCIASTGATGFGLRDLKISFGPTATTRSSGYAVNVQSCANCDFEGLTLNNGDLSGMRLASSVHTTISNLSISNFFANGLFTLNNQDLRVEGVACTNNQDACFETSWYDSQYSTYAIPCQGITATNITSNNDTEAILINACLDVSVNGFAAINSGKESIFVGQDPTTTTAHWPDRVTIANGTIYGAGYGTNANNTTTAQALYVNVVTSPGTAKSKIVFSNINASHIAGWGLAMAELQNDDVQMSNVKFYDVGQGNSGSPVGCLQTEGNEVNLDNVSCSTSGSYSLYDTNTLRLTGSSLVMNASNQLGTGINALYLSTTATGYVNLQNVSVKDTNTTAWASDIYDGSSTGQHQILGISLAGTLTPIGPTSVNGGTTFQYSDPTHSSVLRNGGTIFSFAPPNVYVEPTAGTTSSSQVPGTVFYLQDKCRATPTSAEQVESVGWGIIFPTLTTESFFLNRTGGCGFPLVLDLTTAAQVNVNNLTAQISMSKILNGVSHASMYSGADPGAQITAACADALNKANGNTTGICDMSDMGNITTTSQITLGNTAGGSATLLSGCGQVVTGNMTDGTSAVIAQYGGTTLRSAGFGSSCALTIRPGSASNLGYVYEALTSSTPYLRVEGLELINVSGNHATANGIGAYIDGPFADGTTFTGFNVYDSLDTTAAVKLYNVCCDFTWEESSFNANYGTRAIWVASDTSSSLADQGLHFVNDSIVHPAAGQPVFYCSDTTTNHNDSIVSLTGIYTETSNSDTTTALYQSNGCSRLSLKDVGLYSNVASSTAPGVSISGTAGYVTVEDLTFRSSTGTFTYPATAVSNTVTGQTGTYLTDALGNYNHYSTPNAPSVFGPTTFAAAGAASAPGVTITGAPYTGGTATTNFPQFYLNQGAAVTTLSTAGTEFGINAPSGFTGHLLNLFVNGGSTRFRVDYAGDLFAAGTATITSTLTAPALLPGTLYSAAGTALPTCASGIKGQMAVVSDATSPTYMAAYTSGGGITAAVICSYNGTTYAWLFH